MPLAFSMIVLGGLSLGGGLISPWVSWPLNQVNVQLGRLADTFIEYVAEQPYSVWYVDQSGYPGGLTVFDLPDGEAAIYLDGGVLIDTGSALSANRLVRPTLEQAGVRVETVLLSHHDRGHSHGVAEFPMARTLPRGEGLVGDLYEVKTYPIRSRSKRADDNGQFIMIEAQGAKILYIADSGYEAFDALNGLDLTCDILICGAHAQGESVVEDFLAYTGAHTLIIGRSYYHRELFSKPLVTVYDQYLCGAVRVDLSTGSISQMRSPLIK